MTRADYRNAQKQEELAASRELEHEARIVGEMPAVVAEEVDEAHEPNIYTKQGTKITPKVEQAIRLYATGQQELVDVAKIVGIDSSTLRYAWNSPQGQVIAEEVRGALERKFQSLFDKVIRVVGDALDHPEPSVALAGANLWLRTNKGSKIDVTVTAEDVIAKLIADE